jgi:hypothetical protein
MRRWSHVFETPSFCLLRLPALLCSADISADFRDHPSETIWPEAAAARVNFNVTV